MALSHCPANLYQIAPRSRIDWKRQRDRQRLFFMRKWGCYCWRIWDCWPAFASSKAHGEGNGAAGAAWKATFPRHPNSLGGSAFSAHGNISRTVPEPRIDSRKSCRKGDLKWSLTHNYCHMIYRSTDNESKIKKEICWSNFFELSLFNIRRWVCRSIFRFS